MRRLRSHALRSLLTLTGFAAGAAVLALPAFAEADATRRLEDAISRRTHATDESRARVSLDARGLHLRGLELERAGVAIDIDDLRVRPGLDGIEVELGAVTLRRHEADASPATVTPEPDDATEDDGSDDAADAVWGRLESVADRFRGVPVQVSVEGPIRVERSAGVDELTLRDARIALDAQGGVHGRLHALVRHASGQHEVESTVDGNLRAHALAVGVDYLTPTLGSVHGRVELREDEMAAEVVNGDGRLGLRGRKLADPDARRVSIEASAWSLAPLAPFVANIANGHGLDVDLRGAQLDGALELAPVLRAANGEAPPPATDGLDALVSRVVPQTWLERGGVRLHLQSLGVEGLVLRGRRLSTDAVRFGAITLDGDLSTDGRRHEGVLSLAHGNARVEFNASVSAERVDADVELAELPCAALASSTPRGLLPALEGMRLAGMVSARAGIHFDWDEVRRWTAQQEVSPTEDSPGELSFEFPILEQCRVLREPPGIDVDALAGAYRHRFISPDGTPHERVLGVGAPDFVALWQVPRIARAFTILEDARFWQHEGFDRVHIERALWHDLGVGRMARGASTITQQTARNLWLGTDRSMGRKLQEAFLAERLETSIGKQRILEVYLNIIELGPETFGVEAASQLYFGRSATELNVKEALHLASLAPSPVRYAERFVAGELDAEWEDHLDEQIRRLRIHGYLSRAEATQARREPVRLLDRRP